jgi:hypothetical protein
LPGGGYRKQNRFRRAIVDPLPPWSTESVRNHKKRRSFHDTTFVKIERRSDSD